MAKVWLGSSLVQKQNLGTAWTLHNLFQMLKWDTAGVLYCGKC